MAALTKKEIEAGLKKLGIYSELELGAFFQEYKEYCRCAHDVHSRRVYQKQKLIHRVFSGRLNHVCMSAAAFIGDKLASQKMRAHKQSKR